VLAAALVLAATVGFPAAVAAPAGSPAGVQVFRDLEYGKVAGKPLLLDAYVPAARGSQRPAVVLIHGGGWRVGDKASFAEEAQKMAAMGWVAFSVNYRLDETPTFKAGIEDVQAAVRWVRANVAEFGVDAERVGVLGESAGGHLAALLATVGRGRLFTSSRVLVAASWSGPMDLTALARQRGDGWGVPLMGCSVAACPDRFEQLSPVTHVDSSDAALYLINSTDELVPLRQAQAMADRLRAAGVAHQLDVLPGNRHSLDFRADAWPATVRFLQRHLEGEDPRGDDSSVGTVTFVVAAAAAIAVIAVGVGLSSRRNRRDRRRKEPVPVSR
jgi:acetyl esterase/lipase